VYPNTGDGADQGHAHDELEECDSPFPKPHGALLIDCLLGMPTGTCRAELGIGRSVAGAETPPTGDLPMAGAKNQSGPSPR
jgi:hypothetical protein